MEFENELLNNEKEIMSSFICERKGCGREVVISFRCEVCNRSVCALCIIQRTVTSRYAETVKIRR